MERMKEVCGRRLQWNGELNRVGFLVEVWQTTKGFSKSFSRRELKEELNTSAGKICSISLM